MSATATEPELITLKAACRRFSVSYDWIHAAVLNGDLPFDRPSRQYLVEPAEVRALIKRRTEEREMTR